MTLTTNEAISVNKAMFMAWVNFKLKDFAKDEERLNELRVWDEVVIRARWSKFIDLIFAVDNAMKRYDTTEGELDLISQVFGEQLGLPAATMAADLKTRLEWYKTRIAKQYEKEVKSAINKHSVLSPVEQIFLMEWVFCHVEQKKGWSLHPQKLLHTENGEFKIDFVVMGSGKSRLAIEIDGHEFHEKTKVQARNDRQRERAIMRAGHPVYRFTGSEVFANARSCVEEVVAYLDTDE